MNNEGKHWALGICRRWGRGVRMRASNPLCVGGQPMVALNEQFHHNGTTALRRRLRVTGYGLQRNWESGVNFIDQRSRITDQKRRTSNDLFINHYSLVIERSAGANEIILCGYPDNNRVSTDFGTGLNDPDTGLWYIRSRTYNSIPGTVLRQEPKSRQATGVATRVLQRDPIGYAAGANLYEYVGGRVSIGSDPTGEKCVKLPYELCRQYVKEPHWYSSIYDIHFQHAWIRRGTSGWGFYPKSESVPNVLCSPGVIKDNSGASMLPDRANAPMGGGYKVCEPVWVNTCECNPKKATAGIAKAIQQPQKHPPEYGLFFYDCVDWAGQQLTWGAISGCKGWRKGYGLGWGTLPVQISGVNPGGPAKFWP